MKISGIFALLVFGAFVLSLSVAQVYSQETEATKGKCPFARLTDQQKKAWETNRAAQHKQMKTLFVAMKEKRAALKQELGKDKLDMKKITQINEELKKLDAQKLDLKLQRTLAAQKILTHEQFRRFLARRHGYKGHGYRNHRCKASCKGKNEPAKDAPEENR